MNALGVFIKPAAAKVALGELRTLKNDQLALFFCLAVSNEPVIQQKNKLDSPFSKELLRYLGAPIRGGGVAFFNPLDGKWRSENYLFSTVSGRLLNGSHWWTGVDGFIKRTPAKDWPARFDFDSDGFQNLMRRYSAPNLAYENRLPLEAVAILYFRDQNLIADGLSESSDISDLVALYKNKILHNRPELVGLFRESFEKSWGEIFASQPANEENWLEIYPPSPHSSEPKKNVLLYTDDIAYLQAMSDRDEMIADTLRRLLKTKGKE